MAVSKRLRFEILRRDNYTCRYCGAKAPDVPLRVDHVIPEALGGTDEPSNLVTACEPCNSGKSSIAPDSPIVADVAADALRWARVIELVAQDREEQRAWGREIAAEFTHYWDRWTSTRTDAPFDRPPGWHTSVNQFLNAGLTMNDLIELIDVAMESQVVKDKWRYFCGCAWTRVREAHQVAALLLEEVPNG